MVMASIGNQQTWMPFASTKDCSQGFCSLYCPQWCYIIFPPPPPFDPPSEDSGIKFSPLVIAIIGILASAFVLVSYYTIVSKYCRNVDSLRRIHRHRNEEYDDGGNPSQHDPWQTGTSGLDEALIKSIAVCKYKRGDGLIDGTDCSVCLSEFQDNERLRLLPKCSHAFHVQCIDTWLKSHSNCPLCRADIMPTTSPSPLQLPPPVQESLPDHGTLTEGQEENHTIAAAEDSQRVSEEHLTVDEIVPKSPFRTLSDLGGVERDTIIEIIDEEIQPVGRSLSMDSLCQGRVSIANVLGMSIEDNIQERDRQSPMGAVPPKQWKGEHSEGRINKNKVLHSVMSPIAMKRSSSNGRFFLTRNGRGRNASISILN